MSTVTRVVHCFAGKCDTTLQAMVNHTGNHEHLVMGLAVFVVMGFAVLVAFARSLKSAEMDRISPISNRVWQPETRSRYEWRKSLKREKVG